MFRFFSCLFEDSRECAVLGIPEWRAEMNTRVDRLVGKTAIESGLRVGRSEVLRSLRHYLLTQSQGHHATNHTGVERGSAQRSSLNGRKWDIVNQTNIENDIFKGNVGRNFWKMWRGAAGLFGVCICSYHLELNWTEIILLFLLTPPPPAFHLLLYRIV